MNYILSTHAQTVVEERGLSEDWIRLTIEKPDILENDKDGTTHYIKRIEEREGRYLRVIVNPFEEPKKVVTVFFDRRLRKKYETKN